jgi:hypothetical protein
MFSPAHSHAVSSDVYHHHAKKQRSCADFNLNSMNGFIYRTHKKAQIGWNLDLFTDLGREWPLYTVSDL